MHTKISISCKQYEAKFLRNFCTDKRLSISKFLIQAAYEKIQRDVNGFLKVTK